jgi:hypothetical protein
MLEAVQKCPACLAFFDEKVQFRQSDCELSRCPKTTIPGMRLIKEEPRVAKPRKIVGHRLSPEQIHEIRRLGALQGFSHREIARQFAVSRSAVSQIINHVLWKDLPERAA